MNRNAFYFTIDAMLATLILSGGFLLIYSTTKNQPSDVLTIHLSEDILNLWSSTKITDLCYDDGSWNCPDNPELQDYLRSGDIINYNNTLIESLVEINVSKKSTAELKDLLDELAFDSSIVNSDIFGFDLYINGEQIEHSYDYRITEQNTTTLISSKGIVFGFYEDSGTVSWGPYLVEVRTWLI